jgi:signal transduction histidine kinase/CheY-like chemotaxis protein
VPSVALPVATIAGITLYAGLYHVLIHARVRDRGRKRDLYFGILALMVGIFDLVNTGLYISEDVAEGAVWQRLSLVTLTFSSTCLIYFIDEYAGVPGPTWARRMSWVLVALGLIALCERRGWLLTDVPSIKYVNTSLFGHVVYYEREPGPLFYALYVGILYVVGYVIAVARRTLRAGRAARAGALLLGVLLYMAAFVSDGLLEAGYLETIFLTEYAFAAIIALVGYSLSAEYVEGVQAKQALAEREIRLSHAQRLESLGKLAGGVAHDLNNMLTPVLGYVELTKDRMPEGSIDRTHLEWALDAAERAATLTRQLLALGRKQVLEVRPLDLGESIRKLAPLIRRLLPENVTLDLQIEEHLPWVDADAGQLEQIWMNLAANARDAMPEGGKLTYSVSRDQLEGHGEDANRHGVLVSIRDTGSGISPEQVPHIFEPFFTTKPRGQGTGLGLSIVRGIIEQHGGQIAVDTQLERGTTFRLHFPVSERAPESSPAPTHDTQQSDRGRVLVVDDDTAVRRFTTVVLEQQGYEVETATSLAEVSALLSRLAGLDLLITDVMLEDGDGPKVRTQVTQAFPNVPCLFMTGHADELLAPRGMLREGTELLRKPFTGNVLLNKVRSVLQRSARTRAPATRGNDRNRRSDTPHTT